MSKNNDPHPGWGANLRTPCRRLSFLATPIARLTSQRNWFFHLLARFGFRLSNLSYKRRVAAMTNVLMGIFGFLLFFSPTLIGIATLLLAARHTKRLALCFMWGFVAAIFFTFQFLILVGASDFNSAFAPGGNGYNFAKVAAFFFALCLIIYLFFVFGKFRGKHR